MGGEQIVTGEFATDQKLVVPRYRSSDDQSETISNFNATGLCQTLVMNFRQLSDGLFGFMMIDISSQPADAFPQRLPQPLPIAPVIFVYLLPPFQCQIYRIYRS